MRAEELATEERVVVETPAQEILQPQALTSGSSTVWWIATLLLLSMAGVFMACHLLQGTYPQLAPIRAFSEAALV